jgi:MSHA pilin protein MshD
MAPARSTRARLRGFTLIELVVSITVLSIAIFGVLGALASVSAKSADAMISQQATTIASAYLNEVLQKPFGAADGQTARAALDVVGDYAGLTDVGARDQTGAAVAGLGQYTVTVSVGAGALGAIPAAQLRQVTVTVAHSSGVTVVLSGYRTQYP